MGTLSMIWGVLSLIGMFVAFLPCLGSLNWLNIPFSLVGLVISIVATTKPETQRQGQRGAIMCGIATVVGFIRLALGGGIL